MIIYTHIYIYIYLYINTWIDILSSNDLSGKFPQCGNYKGLDVTPTQEF